MQGLCLYPIVNHPGGMTTGTVNNGSMGLCRMLEKPQACRIRSTTPPRAASWSPSRRLLRRADRAARSPLRDRPQTRQDAQTRRLRMWDGDSFRGRRRTCCTTELIDRRASSISRGRSQRRRHLTEYWFVRSRATDARPRNCRLKPCTQRNGLKESISRAAAENRAHIPARQKHDGRQGARIAAVGVFQLRCEAYSLVNSEHRTRRHATITASHSALRNR
jgi:hypothetical protein